MTLLVFTCVLQHMCDKFSKNPFSYLELCAVRQLYWKKISADISEIRGCAFNRTCVLKRTNTVHDERQYWWRHQGQCFAPVTNVTRRPSGGGGVLVFAGVLAHFRTGLHIEHGTLTSQYYLNNTIKPIIIPMHM